MDNPDNPGEWCTYVQAARRLHKSIGAIRQMALRGKLQRVHGNDGKARVFVTSEHARAANEQPERAESEQPHVQPERAPHVQRPDTQLIKALEAHVETLKAQLAEEKARAEKQADDLVAYDAAYAAGLAAERAKVEAERAKAERLIAEFAARDAQHAADLSAERTAFAAKESALAAGLAAEQARTSEAIAALTGIMQRLDALAAARTRPWWRRLVG